MALVAPAILSPPAPAGAAPCLSHQAARDKYPDAHLYWHTDARCWDDNRRGARHYETPAPPTAVAVDQATAKVHTTVYYPSLTVNSWPLAPLPFVAHDMSSWPLLLDVDAPAKFDRWRDRVQGAWGK